MPWGVILVVIVIVVIVWAVIGATSPATGSNGSAPQGQGCDGCKGLNAWWSGLNWRQKIREAAWYAWKKTDCALRGCSTS